VRSPEPATFSPARADLLEAMRESGGLRFKLEGGLSFTGEKGDERYLVVMTTDELLRERTSISAAGEVPMLLPGFSGTVTKEVRVPHAPGGRVTVSLSPLPPETATGTKSAPVGAEAKAPGSPEFVTVRLVGGTAIGAVELGRTTVEAARRLFEAGGAGLGQERENAATFNAGTTHLAPKRLYTPPGTLHQLYFDDNGVLVLIVDGSPTGLPPTGREFLQRFAGARESGRTMGSYELQAPLARCVTLMAVFRAVGDTLDSAAHAYGCPTR